MKFTVLGATGFIGSHLAEHLKDLGHACSTPARDVPEVFKEPLGHVIYCVGVTADFRRRAFDTVRAHVCLLAEVLEKADFESLLYLSSTRVYARSGAGNEDAALPACPAEQGDLYNLTKMTGESLCFATGRTTVRVARLANVYGDDFASESFLPSIIRAAVSQGSVVLDTALDSEKDYVSIADVVKILPKIAMSGRQGIYNVASGINTSNATLLEMLRDATGCNFITRPAAPSVRFPEVDISRLRREFAYEPGFIREELKNIVERYRNAQHDQH